MIDDRLDSKRPILSVKDLRKEVEQLEGEEVSASNVNYALKEEARLRFRRLTHLAAATNSDRVLVLRQQYAVQMVKLLESGVRVVNIDESLLKKTSFQVKTWGNKHHSKYSLGSTLNPAISLIATIDTEGTVFFSVSTVNTNTSVMRLFLNELRTKYTARDGGSMR